MSTMKIRTSTEQVILLDGKWFVVTRRVEIFKYLLAANLNVWRIRYFWLYNREGLHECSISNCATHRGDCRYENPARSLIVFDRRRYFVFDC